MSEKEREIVAFHEMGHALVALALPTADPLHRVTVIPRGAAGGVTIVRPLEDRHIQTEPQLKDLLTFALGGRAAEEISFNEISTGAQDDLMKATRIARAMVIEFGMSEKVGPLSFAQDGFRDNLGRALFPGANRPDISDETYRVVDEEVSKLVNDAKDRASRILKQKRDLLFKLSRLLMTRETLEGDEVRAYVAGEKKIPAAVDASGNGGAGRRATGRKRQASVGGSTNKSVRPRNRSRNR
jgi:cell division protease FtsH